MFYGSNSAGIKKYKYINFLELASKRGFITSRTNGWCNKEPIDSILSKADYENSRKFCDLHFKENSEKRNCFYGKDSFDYLFEFWSKFLDLYKNERKIVYYLFINNILNVYIIYLFIFNIIFYF